MSGDMRWRFEPSLDQSLPLIDRLKLTPREVDLPAYALRLTVAAVTRVWMHTYHRLRVVGSELLPRDGRSYVLIANHCSHLDAPALSCAVPLLRAHHVFPAAAEDYFFKNAPRALIAAVGANAIPFNRRAHARESLSVCRSLLAQPGNVLILFPEGSRSQSGCLGDFKPGIGMILAGLETPVFPCWIKGAHRAWPKVRKWPLPTSVTLRIGQPTQFAQTPRNKAGAVSITTQLRDAVSALA